MYNLSKFENAIIAGRSHFYIYAVIFQRKEGLPPYGALEAGNLQSAPVAVNGQVYSIEVAKEADYNSLRY